MTAPTYTNFQDVKRRKPFKRWHEAIVDDLLAFPLDKGAVRAKRLGYTESYLNVIVNSDMFKAYYASRRREYTERLNDSLVHKTSEVASKALDLMLEQLDKKRTDIPFATLADVTDKTLTRLGYGVKSGSPVQVNVDARAVTVSKDDLASARSALRAVENNRAALLPAQTIVEPEGV